MTEELWRRLSSEGLLRGGAPGRGPLSQLCHRGALVGGLSAARGVSPDELLGPLCFEVGGTARTLKVLDVRGEGPLELEVSLSGRRQLWKVRGLSELADALNLALAEEPTAKAILDLGEWEEARQLWCVEKRHLGWLAQLARGEVANPKVFRARR